jgi:hypothetical protein
MATTIKCASVLAEDAASPGLTICTYTHRNTRSNAAYSSQVKLFVVPVVATYDADSRCIPRESRQRVPFV